LSEARSTDGREEKCIKYFWEGKRSLEIPKRRWECNIIKELKEIVWEGMDWIHVAKNRTQWRAVLNTVMSLRVP
jgi:hypothetical protein